MTLIGDIKKYIAEHPEWETLTDQEVANIINTYTTSKYVALGSDWLLEWALVNGVYQRFSATVDNPETPTELKYTLKGILLVIERDGTTLRMEKPEIQGMLNTLMGYGLLTQAEIDSLNNTATITECIWEKMGRPFDADDVRIARETM